jgi:hypothetical protein
MQFEHAISAGVVRFRAMNAHLLTMSLDCMYMAAEQVGEIQEHPGDFNSYRIGSEEKRAQERMEADLYPKVYYIQNAINMQCFFNITRS